MGHSSSGGTCLRPLISHGEVIRWAHFPGFSPSTLEARGTISQQWGDTLVWGCNKWPFSGHTDINFSLLLWYRTHPYPCCTRKPFHPSVWEDDRSQDGELAPSGATRQGRPGQCRVRCCSKPALGGLLPSDPGCLQNPSAEENNPKPLRVLWLSLKEKRTNSLRAPAPGPLAPPGGRNRAVPGLHCILSPTFPLLCRLHSFTLDCTSTGCQAPATRWGHRPCPVTVTPSLPRGACHSFTQLTHSFDKYSWSSCSPPGSPLGSRDTNPAHTEFTV